MKAAILTDTTKCIGCRECVVACKRTYGLGPDVPRRWSSDDGLSARNWTAVVEKPGPKFIRKQCRHCLEPACASACPVGALHKTPEGPVVYDSSKCIGCRYCMMACPYGIPRYDWEQAVPYVRKCVLCHERVQKGQQPACVEACPTKATIFGERETLLAEAKKRIAENPGLYQAKVFGESEVGGTSVLYISDTDLSFLTYGRPLGDKPLPTLTAPAMQAVPAVFVGMGALMSGLWWLTNRRNKVKQTETADAKKDETHG
ncbi:MAG: 4Fe-4S dicluster domain-containing protein [Myxococcales bacterium]|nr:MAG: 4Fe-4S dicluster domain-containing protein [Myxococcales bacterium]